MPIRSQGHDLLVEPHRDAAAHGHDHAFAEQRLSPLLPVLHNVAGHQVQPRLRADDRLQARPARLRSRGCVFFNGLGDLIGEVVQSSEVGL